MKARCRCGRPSIYVKSGLVLCRSHFLGNIEKKVKKTVGKGRMLAAGDRIAFALSGGADSAVAAYIVHDILKQRKDIKYSAVMLDDSTKSGRQKLEKAKNLCKKLGIGHHVFSCKSDFGIDMKSLQKIEGIEPSTRMGIARKYMLNKAARQLKAAKLCVGHTLDDEAQTIIMNFLRGDLSKASRAGFAVKKDFGERQGRIFVPRIKPLREISEEEIKLYASLKGIAHAEKKSMEGGIRADVSSFLDKMEKKQPGAKLSILHTFGKLLPYVRKASGEKSKPLLLCSICGEPTAQRVCRACELWHA